MNEIPSTDSAVMGAHESFVVRLIDERERARALAVRLEQELAEITDAAAYLLDALKRDRQPYRQTARNAPTAEQVRASKRQRIAHAEGRLRELIEGDRE